MISQKMQDAINEMINKEIYSEYLYLSMAAYLDSISLSGMANFMKIQVQEERSHALKFYDFLNERGGRVILSEIKAPKVHFDSPTQLFEEALHHEEFVTKSINELMDIAIAENDHAARSFLNWYVDEQVEEEANADEIVQQLKFIEGNKHAIYMLDREMAQRTFVDETTEE